MTGHFEPLGSYSKINEGDNAMVELKTNMSQDQLDQLAELITFTVDNAGTLRVEDINGSVWGNVGGDVWGDVGGDVWESVKGSVKGDIGGDVWGDVGGDVGGNIGGGVEGSVFGVCSDCRQAIAALKETTP